MSIIFKSYLLIKRNTKILSRSLFLYNLFFILSANVFASDIADIEFSKDSQNLVLSYTETHGIMSGDDSVTTVKVYGNGMVKVHYPVFMKRAGDYQMMLNESQLNELLQTLAKKNIPELDLEEVKSEKINQERQSRLSDNSDLFAVFDASITTLEINFDRYTKANQTQSENSITENLSGFALEIVDLQKTIKWEGLRIDSNRFPNIKALQDLSAVQSIITDIAESDQLIKGN